MPARRTGSSWKGRGELSGLREWPRGSRCYLCHLSLPWSPRAPTLWSLPPSAPAFCSLLRAHELCPLSLSSPAPPAPAPCPEDASEHARVRVCSDGHPSDDADAVPLPQELRVCGWKGNGNNVKGVRVRSDWPGSPGSPQCPPVGSRIGTGSLTGGGGAPAAWGQRVSRCRGLGSLFFSTPHLSWRPHSPHIEGRRDSHSFSVQVSLQKNV